MRRFVFVCSGHRSGSTLFSLVLGSHSRALAVGEFDKLPDCVETPEYECNCGAKPIQTCPHWSAVVAMVAERTGWNAFDAPRAHHWKLVGNNLPDKLRMRLVRRGFRARPWSPLRAAAYAVAGRSAVDDCVHITRQMFAAAAEVADVDVIIDAVKDPARARAVLDAEPEARILFFARDGRGVMASHLSTKDKYARWHRDPAAAARRWVRENNRIEQALRGLPPDRWMHVRYDAFCTDPESVCRDVCSFAGLDYEPAMLTFSDHVHHMVGGNRMRYRSDRAIALDEKWRQTLSAEDLAIFERIGGAMQRRLGFT